MVEKDWSMAQQSVVGSVLISPEVLPLVLRICKPADMQGSCATVYAAMQALELEGATVDPVTVLERVGPAYREELLRMMQQTPTAANAEVYARICAEQSRLSRLHELAAQLMGVTRMEDALPMVQGMTEALASSKSDRITPLSDAITEFCDRHDGPAPKYVPFGFPKLDERLTAELGDVVVLGGYRSDGKSALMLQWMWTLSREYSVGVYSLETNRKKLEDRFMASAAGIGLDVIKHNKLGSKEWDQAIYTGSMSCKRKPVDLIEAAGWSVTDILSTALARHHQVVMIDYVQLIEPGTQRRGGTRAEEVAEISRALQQMAHRHGILVVELSQLTDQATTGGKIVPPTLASLRESKQLANDADIVMLLYRIKPNSSNSRRRLHIAKNKDGETGMIELDFNGRKQRFSEAKEEDLDDRFAQETLKRLARKKAEEAVEELPQ